MSLEVEVVEGVVEEDSGLPSPPVDDVLFVESWPPEEELVPSSVSLSADPEFAGLVHDVRHARNITLV